MTCDDKDNHSVKETQEIRNLKRKQGFDEDVESLGYINSDHVNNTSSETSTKNLKSGTKMPLAESLLVQNGQENENLVEDTSNANVAKHSKKKKKRLEIETEFKILKSLIPKVANKQTFNELEIIDACVNYIEALQEQLNIRIPQENDGVPLQGDDDSMSTSIRSIMSAIADEQVEGINRLHAVKDDEMDDYLDNESSEDDDFSDDEIDEDNNNNKEATVKEASLVEKNENIVITAVKDINVHAKNTIVEDNKLAMVGTDKQLTSNLV